MSESKSNSYSSLLYIIIAALMITLIGVTYLWLQMRSENYDEKVKNLKVQGQLKKENSTLKSELSGINEMLKGHLGGISTDLTSDLTKMLETYDQLIKMDASKADSLNLQKNRINELLGRLNNLNKTDNFSAQELLKIKKENDALRNIMKGYVEQIDKLNTLNVKLTFERDSTQVVLNATTTERDTYKRESEEKTEQLMKGAKLQTYGIRTEALRMKLNNTTEPTEKSKNVYQIKSSFTLLGNQLASGGKKTLYMQVISPSGSILQNKGTNVFNNEMGEQPFSDKRDIDYNNQSIDVSIFFEPLANSMTKGNYKIKIFCDGVTVATDSFTLK